MTFVLADRAPKPNTIQSEKPIQNLHVITSYFNPCGYRRLRDNYFRFRDSLNAPLHTIELLFGDREPDIQDAHHVRSNTVLWHKEALLNILIDRLPQDVDAIAWVDADILFQNPRWVQDTCDELGRRNVVSLFTRAWHKFPDGTLQPHKQSTGRLFSQANRYWSNFTVSHPGFALAARADWLRRHKLSDIHVIGGGDTFMVSAFAGVSTSRMVGNQNRMNPMYRAAHLQWQTTVNADVQRAFGYVPGDIHHLWHGNKQDRRYILRYDDLKTFNPMSDLVREPSGLWTWSATADPLMVDAVKRHFDSRNEDAEYVPELHPGLVHTESPALA